MDDDLFIWSVPLAQRQTYMEIAEVASDKTVGNLIVRIREYFKAILRRPVHIFATEGNEWYEDDPQTVTNGYWYCAGNFYGTNQDKVTGARIGWFDSPYAKCIAAPGIKRSDAAHSEYVISGKYFINYVCYNIANRILYTADRYKNGQIRTVDDLPFIDKRGTKFIVNGWWGVYGTDQRDFATRTASCRSGAGPSSPDDPIQPVDNTGGPKPPSPKKPPTKSETDKIENELPRRSNVISKIHLNAASGNVLKANEISQKLKDIDSEYHEKCLELWVDYNNQAIDIVELNQLAGKVAIETIYATRKAIGRRLTQRIYGVMKDEQEIRDRVVVKREVQPEEKLRQELTSFDEDYLNKLKPAEDGEFEGEAEE